MADVSIPKWRVVEVLGRLATQGIKAKVITKDDGPEFSGRALSEWEHGVGVKLDFTRPGKPVENTYIESFKGKFRENVLITTCSSLSMTMTGRVGMLYYEGKSYTLLAELSIFPANGRMAGKAIASIGNRFL